MSFRDRQGRFLTTRKRKSAKPRAIIEHNYNAHGERTSPGIEKCSIGRRIVEMDVLLSNLQSCQQCRLGPVALSHKTLVGELPKGLSGYFYVRCENPDCNYVNRVPYGSTHKIKKKGMPCFVINTKLGAGKNVYMCRLLFSNLLLKIIV